MIVKKNKVGRLNLYWWWRPLKYVIALLVTPIAAFIINSPFFLFLHVMPATICYIVVPADNTRLIDVCFILGQYHWVAELAVIGLLVCPCFFLFFCIDSYSYKERRKRNKKHAGSCWRFILLFCVGLVLSLAITAPYQITILRVCRPGGYSTRFISPPPDALVYNGHYYFLRGDANTALTYPQAMKGCKEATSAMGFEPPFAVSAWLVSIESEQEQKAITDFLSTHHNHTGVIRIGGIKEPPEWKHYWDRGSYRKQDLSYTHWSPNAENEGWGNCISLEKNENVTGKGDVQYFWIPESCTRQRSLPYLCEVPAQVNYMLCSWISSSIFMAIFLVIFTIIFIAVRSWQLKHVKLIEFPQDIPALVITAPEDDTEL